MPSTRGLLRDLLVEIGTEELPPSSLERLGTALATHLGDQLKTAGFNFAEATHYVTPRRLAVMLRQVPESAEARETQRRGPSVKRAWEQDGTPTKALLGFAKSCGVTELATLKTLGTEAGEWVTHVTRVPGEALSTQLESLLQAALAKLPIERRMRWGKHRDEFVRPVQWLLALHGKTLIPVQLFGLTASKLSHGHRGMSPGTFQVASAKDYVNACHQHYVIPELSERKARIRAQLEKIARPGTQVVIDEPLLSEVAALVEWPVVLAGKFDEAFLQLPQAVLISAMKKHQRYFHLKDTKSEALLPEFITVANIEPANTALIIAGNERVIRPRLADAAFFFSQDTKATLASKLAGLKQVLFQSELGTYYDKAHRIAALARWLSQAGDGNAATPDAAYRAGLVCKVDLLSDMVTEFPDLQGVMGGCYARKDGEPEAVAQAISEQYMPTRAGGDLPATPLGAWVALADKLDTLVGLFGIKQPPTGSRDPFALRRQARGIIRICIEKQLDLELLPCLQAAAAGYSRGLHLEFELAPVHAYIMQRLGSWYSEQNIAADVIAAVQQGARASSHLYKMHQVVTRLHDFRQEPIAQQIIAANKRVANILSREGAKEVPGDRAGVEAAILEEAAEVALHQQVKQSRQALAATTDVDEQLRILAALQPDIDQFFEQVLVMTALEAVTRNRLALLQEVRSLFLEVADFSFL